MQSAIKDIKHEHAKEEPNVNAVWHLKDKVAAAVAAKGEPTSGTISSTDMPATHKGDATKNINAAEQHLLQKAAKVRASTSLRRRWSQITRSGAGRGPVATTRK